MPVPSEMKKADRFICALGLKLMKILGYDRRDLPAAMGRILTYFPGPGHKRWPMLRQSSRLLSFSNTVSGEITLVEYVVSLDKLGVHDVEHVGQERIPGRDDQQPCRCRCIGARRLATTAQAYRDFLELSGLNDQIHAALDAWTSMTSTPWPRPAPRSASGSWKPNSRNSSRNPYRVRHAVRRQPDMAVAVRSSATAEDLPDASFAGQQETFLNIRGVENVIRAAKEVFASLFNDRAIAYRVHQGFDHKLVALSAGVQRMVRSETGTAGVMFTLDTESGFRDVVFITGAYGLGETVVQGAVNPDEFYVHKPTLRRAPGDPAPQPGLQADQDGLRRRGQGRSFGQDRRVDKAERARFCLTDAEVSELAKARDDHREALRPPDGHRVGQGR
jgi:pyruvate,water dikinase